MAHPAFRLPVRFSRKAIGNGKKKRANRDRGWRLLAIDLISVADPDLVALDVSGNGASTSQRISADGRYVVFQSEASNLVAGEDNFSTDVFLRDRLQGTTTPVSTGSGNSSSQPGDQRSRLDSGLYELRQQPCGK